MRRDLCCYYPAPVQPVFDELPAYENSVNASSHPTPENTVPGITAVPRDETPIAPERRFCTNCGTPAAPDTVFCTNCGVRLGLDQ